MKLAWWWLWRAVWMLSEDTGIPLGRLAPWVFSQMIHRPGKRVER